MRPNEHLVMQHCSQEFLQDFAKILSHLLLSYYNIEFSAIFRISTAIFNSYFQNHFAMAVSKLEKIQSFFKIRCFIKGVLLISMHVSTCSVSNSIRYQSVLTLPVLRISKNCITVKNNSYFYFHTSLRCLIFFLLRFF